MRGAQPRRRLPSTLGPGRSPGAAVCAAIYATAIAAASAWTSVGAAQDVESITRELTTIEGQADALTQESLDSTERRSATHVEERLTDGELFYRLQDYIRASIIFTDIVDNYPTHAAYTDALFLLGDSLFRAGDYLGARTRFREIIAHSQEQRFRPYVQRALGRLIEIAIHTRDFDGVEEVFQQLSRLPPAEIEATTTYFRAKYLYNRAVPTDDLIAAATPEELTAVRAQIDTAALEQARQAFESVAEGSPYYAQSRYFIGVIQTLREQYPQAIEAFARVLRSEASTTEEQAVAELAHLALGRLYYETDQLDQAVEAYQAVPRTSVNFDIALYEIAWVYIRMGDATRAERALEVLSLAEPDSRFIPDAKLLRGNLLLRNGRYAEAQVVFEEVRQQFGPVRDELDEMLRTHDADPQGYFRQLVRDNMESFDANAFLPPLAQRWASLEGDFDRGLGVLQDLAQARELVEQTTQLVQRLTAALSQHNRVAIFADLRRQSERATQLRNRVARLRQQLIGLESQRGGSPELEAVRAQRRELERFIGEMPTSDEAIDDLDDEILHRFTRLERELARMEVELFGMEARAAAIDSYLGQLEAAATPEHPFDANGAAAMRAELANHNASIEAYRAQIQAFRIEIEAARLQVGVGDDRYARQERLRSEYARLVDREHELGGGDASFDRLYHRMDVVEHALEERDAEIERIANVRAADIQRQVEEESGRIEGYRTALDGLEAEAEVVVGAVTYRNFRAVQHRFYDLVLRADVGDIDVAWAIREEHRMRVEMLTLSRTHEMQALDDEFREIMDESSTGGGDEDAEEGGAAP
jgi:TolA-binding protein